MFICSGDMFVQGMFVQEVCLSMYREYFCLFGDVFVQGMCLSFSDIYLSVQGMFVQEICLSMFRGYIFVCSGEVCSGDVFKYVQGIYICLFRGCVWCAGDLLWRDVLHCYLPQEWLPSGHKVSCLTLTHVPQTPLIRRM